MERFQVNPRAPGDVIHVRGMSFKKGVIYDPKILKLPGWKYERLFTLNLKGMPFFMKLEASPEGPGHRVPG